ncbi:hypothetical protein F5882DRAFT_414097 [Hyaloscypha sp. PMI_1271]|nr:hypothetical protein F5882DRAFT_414097 [Hyaloscypha sp. PMI_1271]
MPPTGGVRTPVSPSINDTMNPAISDAEPVFTVFPKLPPEMRLKIWKHALPGPRVVPYVPGRRRQCVGKRCSAVNSTIKITYVCRESYQVVRSAYEKLPVIFDPSTVQCSEKQPYVYVDYSIDAIYVELDWFALEEQKAICPHLSKAKHVATNECNMRNPKVGSPEFWDILQVSFPIIERVTFIIMQWRLHDHEYTEEWAVVPFPSEPRYNFALTDFDNSPGRALLSDEVGQLKLLVAESQALREEIDSYINDHPEWGQVSFEVGLRARKTSTSNYWKIHSCDPISEEVPDDDLCSICGEQRWATGQDDYWLFEGREEDVGGSEDSTNSVEDVLYDGDLDEGEGEHCSLI